MIQKPTVSKYHSFTLRRIVALGVDFSAAIISMVLAYSIFLFAGLGGLVILFYRPIRDIYPVTGDASNLTSVGFIYLCVLFIAIILASVESILCLSNRSTLGGRLVRLHFEEDDHQDKLDQKIILRVAIKHFLILIFAYLSGYLIAALSILMLEFIMVSFSYRKNSLFNILSGLFWEESNCWEQQNSAGVRSQVLIFRSILAYIVAMLIAVCLFLVLRFTVFHTAQVQGISMEYSYHNNEQILLSLLEKDPKRGQVVAAVSKSKDINEGRNLISGKTPGSDKMVIKRVVGLPGNNF
jgi:Signal peptidase, peptidase S26/RDD family